LIRSLREKKLDAFRAGEVAGGHFWPVGSTEQESQGFLRWSKDGALLELIEPVANWPVPSRGESFAIHGYLRDLGEVSLLAAWPKSWELGDRVYRFSSSLLAFGPPTDLDRRWPRAIYSTANLSEWRRDSGLQFSKPNVRARPQHTRVDIQPPETAEVDLPRARLLFSGRADFWVGDAADWSIHTWQTLTVDPKQPRTIPRFRREYGDVLTALTAFIADRNDDVTFEVYRDPATGERIEVWNSGRTAQEYEWHAIKPGILFHADEIPDLRRAIRRWWKTHEVSWPALGVFGSQYRDGNSYSPARLITVYSALEAYGRARHGTKDLTKLRDYGRVPSHITGCTNPALNMLNLSRGYFAHYASTGQKYSVEAIEESVLPSIRRGSALMQSCVLREFGFGRADASDILARHYRSWPLT
jgi:hypothetical protein